MILAVGLEMAFEMVLIRIIWYHGVEEKGIVTDLLFMHEWHLLPAHKSSSQTNGRPFLWQPSHTMVGFSL